MSPAIEFLNSWSNTWWHYVLFSGWQGALVGAALLAIVLVGRRLPSPLRYALLVIALLKFLTPPFAALPSGALSQFAVSHEAQSTVERATQEMLVAPAEQGRLSSDAWAIDEPGMSAIGSAKEGDWALMASPVPGAEPSTASEIAQRTHQIKEPTGAAAREAPTADGGSFVWSVSLMLLHLAGSLVCLGVIVLQAARLRRLVRESNEVRQGALFERFSQLAGRLAVRRLPRLYANTSVESPFSCGIVHPEIVIPTALAENLRRDEIDLVLAHELAHHRRGDLAVNWLQALVHTLWWFHPVVWLVNLRLRAVREDCCDDLVLAARLADENQYCDTLLRVAASSHAARLPALALPMSCRQHSLSRRFRRLMDASMPHAAGLSRPGLLFTLIIAAVLLPGLSTGDEPAENAAQLKSQNNVAQKSTKQAGAQPKRIEAQKQAQAAGATGAAKSAETASRAWYLLSQTDCSGLLNGLPLRLFQAATAERRVAAVWKGVDNGARLKIRIDTEGKVTGDILVGFFADVNWESAEPAQVRSFPGPGEYTVDRLIPGKYWLGAIAGTVADFVEGSVGKGAGMGVEKNWPKPLELRAAQESAAHVRVSNNYRLETNQEHQFRGHFGLHKPVDPAKRVIIKTVDREGKPVPYCSVTLQELVRNDDTKIDRFHGVGTDENGQGNCDAFAGRYRVTAQKVDFIPELFAMRIRGRAFPFVYEVGNPPVVAAPIDPVPTGTATLSGRVHDQFGKPLRGFYMGLRRYQKRGPFDSDTYYLSLPFTSDDGSYSVTGLPPGEYGIHIRHFDYPTYDWDFGQFKVTIPEEPNARVKAGFEVEAKQLFYGRAVFDDKTPVTKGTWSAKFGGQQWSYFALGINEDGTFRVSLSAEEKRKVDKYQRGTVRVSAYLADKGESTVDVPLAKLSRDAANPATVVIAAKPQGDRLARFDEMNPFENEVLSPEALAWICDLHVLGREDRTLQLSEFKGKPMLLNLYSPRREWIEELPQLSKLHKEYADKGLVMLVICGDDTIQAKEFLKSHSLPFPIAADVDGYAVDVFRRRHRAEPSYQTNVVLDGSGKRLLHQVGLAGDNLKKLRAAIEEAIKSPSD